MAFDETFVSSDRAFVIAFVFGSLANLEQVDSIAAQFFFYAAWAYVFRFFTGFEDNRGLAGFGQKKCGNRENQKHTNSDFHGCGRVVNLCAQSSFGGGQRTCGIFTTFPEVNPFPSTEDWLTLQSRFESDRSAEDTHRLVRVEL